MKTIIDYAKNIRKQGYLKNKYAEKYAFVGIGNHSIHNLYPILDYLRVDLKYIVVTKDENSKLITDNFKDIKGTTDLDMVLRNPEIKGVFVCASPNSHFKIAEKVINAGKNLFIEKPICLTYNELQQLIILSKENKVDVVVGFQKRFAPTSILIKEKIKKHIPISYDYTFTVGSYPEGDVMMDVFIHPLDLVTYLFGANEVLSYQKGINHQTKGSDSYFIHLRHKNGVIGNIKLSSNYSWNLAKDILSINTQAGEFLIENNETFKFEKKTKTILGIPLEKVFKQTYTTETYLDRNGSLPTMQNNQLYTSGYYGEIINFLDICETSIKNEISSIEMQAHTYQLLQQLK